MTNDVAESTRKPHGEYIKNCSLCKKEPHYKHLDVFEEQGL